MHYKPRSGKVNSNFDKFNKDQMAYVTSTLESLLKYFDYSDDFGLKDEKQSTNYQNANAKNMSIVTKHGEKKDLPVQSFNDGVTNFRKVGNRSLANFNALASIVNK